MHRLQLVSNLDDSSTKHHVEHIRNQVFSPASRSACENVVIFETIDDEGRRLSFQAYKGGNRMHHNIMDLIIFGAMVPVCEGSDDPIFHTQER